MFGAVPRSRVVAFAVMAILLLLALQTGSSAAAGTTNDGNVTLYRGPATAMADADAVETAIENGTLEQTDKVVVGDGLLAVIESDRLAEVMASGNGTTTDRFLAAREGNGTFRIIQLNPAAERPRKVARTGLQNLSVYRNGTTVFVLVDTAALNTTFRGEDRNPAQIRDGDRFAVTFGFDLEAPISPTGPAVEFYRTTAEFQPAFRYEPLAPEIVNRTVRINIESDDRVVAKLTLDGRPTMTVPVEPVSWSGDPGVSFDLREVEPGTAYTLELVHDGAVVDRYNGTVLAPKARVSNATVTEVTTQHVVTRDGDRVTETIDDQTAVNATVLLSHGGQVLVYNEDCERIGYAWVEAGVETRVSVELWSGGQPVRDRDPEEFAVSVRAVRRIGAERVPYLSPAAQLTVNGAGSECGQVVTPTGTKATTSATDISGSATMATTSATPIETPVEPESSPDEESPTDVEITSPGQPGFTGATAVIAVLVLIGTVSRRS